MCLSTAVRRLQRETITHHRNQLFLFGAPACGAGSAQSAEASVRLVSAAGCDHRSSLLSACLATTGFSHRCAVQLGIVLDKGKMGPAGAAVPSGRGGADHRGDTVAPRSANEQVCECVSVTSGNRWWPGVDRTGQRQWWRPLVAAGTLPAAPRPAPRTRLCHACLYHRCQVTKTSAPRGREGRRWCARWCAWLGTTAPARSACTVLNSTKH